jgi:hypothetical protein
MAESPLKRGVSGCELQKQVVLLAQTVRRLFWLEVNRRTWTKLSTNRRKVTTSDWLAACCPCSSAACASRKALRDRSCSTSASRSCNLAARLARKALELSNARCPHDEARNGKFEESSRCWVGCFQVQRARSRQARLTLDRACGLVGLLYLPCFDVFGRCERTADNCSRAQLTLCHLSHGLIAPDDSPPRDAVLWPATVCGPLFGGPDCNSRRAYHIPCRMI